MDKTLYTAASLLSSLLLLPALSRNGSSGNSIGVQEGSKTVFGGNCRNRDENGIHVTRKVKLTMIAPSVMRTMTDFKILTLREMPNAHVYL